MTGSVTGPFRPNRTGRPVRGPKVGIVSVAAGLVLAVTAWPAPAAAGVAPPGTGITPGPPRTVRPWISVGQYRPGPSGDGGVTSYSLVVTGAGFPYDPASPGGTQLVLLSFTVEPRTPTVTFDDRVLVPLNPGFDCADRTVLDDTCRYYGAGELRPLRVLIGGQRLVPQCGERLRVEVSTRDASASASLAGPC